MNYYEHHLGDYIRDTAHLSMLEDGAYRRLLDVYYTREAPLPADEAEVFRLIRAKNRNEQHAARVSLREFFTLTDAGWRNKRCDLEIEAAHRKSEAARQNGLASAAAKRQRALNGRTTGVQRKRNKPSTLQSPDTRYQEEPPLPPEGLDGEAWSRWEVYRETIRKPIKPVSMQAAQRELAGYGADQSAVVEHSIANGYQGLIAPKVNGRAPVPAPPKKPPPTPEQITEAHRKAAEDNVRQLQKLGLRP